ncbi:hypothetical protein KM043_008069 [Ampulex compressa]|nr:hypothetical protein KM043_008069 [Ampulex compressa]
MSYADIMGKVIAESDLKLLRKRVTQIRCTRAGELLLELGRPRARELQTTVLSELKEAAEVQTLTHKEFFNIGDMDKPTTKEEVVEAINALGGSRMVILENMRLRRSHSGAQAATILLSVTAAKKILQAGKGSIGWVNCLVGLREASSHCFKYHEIGHLARNCNSAVD